jgi:hypothetical protein
MQNKIKASLLFIFWIFMFLTMMDRFGFTPNFGLTIFKILVCAISATIAVAFIAKKVFGWPRY